MWVFMVYGGQEELPPLSWRPASLPELELTRIHPGDTCLEIWEQEIIRGFLSHPYPQHTHTLPLKAEPEEERKPRGLPPGFVFPKSLQVQRQSEGVDIAL